jgi:hypothetical protein
MNPCEVDGYIIHHDLMTDYKLRIDVVQSAENPSDTCRNLLTRLFGRRRVKA